MKNTKEAAKQRIDRFREYCQNSALHYTGEFWEYCQETEDENAKQCALLEIDAVIETVRGMGTLCNSDELTIEHLQQEKAEIEKL